MFGYVLCNIQSNSSAAIEGFRRLKMVTAGFSVAIVLVSSIHSCDSMTAILLYLIGHVLGITTCYTQTALE